MNALKTRESELVFVALQSAKPRNLKESWSMYRFIWDQEVATEKSNPGNKGIRLELDMKQQKYSLTE